MKALVYILITICYLAVLTLVAWVFYITRNPLSFALVFILPLMRSEDNSDV